MGENMASVPHIASHMDVENLNHRLEVCFQHDGTLHEYHFTEMIQNLGLFHAAL